MEDRIEGTITICFSKSYIFNTKSNNPSNNYDNEIEDFPEVKSMLINEWDIDEINFTKHD